MKTSMLNLAIPLLLVSLTLQAQNAEKTLVRAFNLQGNNSVLLDIKGHVDVQTWSQEQMRVLMNVNLPKGSEMMLKNLVKVGRYNLTAEEENGSLKIFAPGLDRQVKLRNGSELEENISMTIYVPSTVQVITREEELLTENLENK